MENSSKLFSWTIQRIVGLFYSPGPWQNTLAKVLHAASIFKTTEDIAWMLILHFGIIIGSHYPRPITVASILNRVFFCYFLHRYTSSCCTIKHWVFCPTVSSCLWTKFICVRVNSSIMEGL